MRTLLVVVTLGILLGWVGAASAQAAEAPPTPGSLTPLVRTAPDPATRKPFTIGVGKPTSEPDTATLVWRALTRNLSWLPGLLLFLGAVVKGDRGAWWFLFLAGVATLVLFGAPWLLHHHGAWLQSTTGTLVGTGVMLVVAFGLFVLHQHRLDIYARTEITFGVIGIGYSIHLIDDNPGMWAGLIVSVYGLVEGLTRLREADGDASLLGAFDGPR